MSKTKIQSAESFIHNGETDVTPEMREELEGFFNGLAVDAAMHEEDFAGIELSEEDSDALKAVEEELGEFGKFAAPEGFDANELSEV